MMGDWFSEKGVLMSILGVLTAVGSAWLTFLKIAKNRAESKALEKAEIIQTAKEEVSSLRKEIEAKFLLMENRLEQVKDSTEQDFVHLKESHQAEMENLSEKLDLLRDDLKTQHSQMMSLIDRLLER